MLPMFMQKPFDVQYFQHIKRLFGTALIGYWPVDEAAGASTVTDYSGQANDGTPSNVTFGQAGIGDGRTSGSFNGTSSYVDVYSAGFVADFTPSELSVVGWLKVATGEWDSATQRRIINIQTSTSLLTIRKSAANTLQALYNGGGTTDSVAVGGQTSEDWICFGLTVSVSADQLKFFLGGVQAGATQTGIGTWGGTLISSAAVIGSANSETPANVWSGNLAHLIVLNRVATPQEIAEAARSSV